MCLGTSVSFTLTFSYCVYDSSYCVHCRSLGRGFMVCFMTISSVVGIVPLNYSSAEDLKLFFNKLIIF